MMAISGLNIESSHRMINLILCCVTCHFIKLLGTGGCGNNELNWGVRINMQGS